MATLKDGKLYSVVKRHHTLLLLSHTEPLAFFTALPQLSDQKISMKFYLILRKLHRSRKIFLKIMLRPYKINLLMQFFCIISNDISSRPTTWTKQNKKHIFLRKLSSSDPILYIHFFNPFNRPRRLLKWWHLFPFHREVWAFWGFSVRHHQMSLAQVINYMIMIANGIRGWVGPTFYRHLSYSWDKTPE